MTSTHPAAPVPDPGPDGASTSTSESRADRFARFGRRARLYAGAVAFVVLLSGLIVLISANTHSVKLSWAAGSIRASLVWIVLAAAVLGWLLGITTAVVFRHRTRRPR
jgi:uncharacterized integral membrane protein